MKHTIPMIDGDEFDALTKWKKLFKWNPGRRKWIKRKLNKRERKQYKFAVRQQSTESEFYHK